MPLVTYLSRLARAGRPFVPVLLFISTGVQGSQPEPCPAFSDLVKEDLTSYVQKRYHISPNANLHISESSAVGDTCYQKVRFEARGTAVFSLILYVSPDRRFLTTNLFDAHSDPVEEDRRANRETALKLAQGNPMSTSAAGAPVTLVVFADFQCPHCKRFAALLKELSLLTRLGPPLLILFGPPSG
jgi:hypothetical protein